MTRIARIGFITGSVVLILTGALHSATHFSAMSGMDVRAHMDAFGAINLFGRDAQMFDLWQGLSYLMGFFAAALGAVNLAALSALVKGAHPPRGVAIVNMVMQGAICWSGIVYLSAFQAVGGPIGIVMFGLTLLPRKSAP